jgi:hypothetical protein
MDAGEVFKDSMIIDPQEAGSYIVRMGHRDYERGTVRCRAFSNLSDLMAWLNAQAEASRIRVGQTDANAEVNALLAAG